MMIKRNVPACPGRQNFGVGEILYSKESSILNMFATIMQSPSFQTLMSIRPNPIN